MGKTVKEVEEFWDSNPLFSDESQFEPGSEAFFAEHERVYLQDVFAGYFPEDLLIPKLKDGARILDLGCGVGFWTILLKRALPNSEFYAADLTQTALDMTERRLKINGLQATLSKQNAEQMSFPKAHFDHVNCQGVIHHTPDTQAAITEIARVLRPGGTAYISVYYRNFFLRNWKLLSPIGKMIGSLGGKLKGRGRDSIFMESDVDEITRLYDGDKNPIGKSYSQHDILELVRPYFEVDRTFLNFFPARALPFRIPARLHRYLSRKNGFMIHLNMTKKPV